MGFARAPFLLLLASALANAQPAPANCGDPAVAKKVADGFERQLMLIDAERKLMERAAQGKAEEQIDQLVEAGKLSIAQRDAVLRDWQADPRFKKLDGQKWAEIKLASDAAGQARASSKKLDLKQACVQAQQSIHHFKRANEHDGALYTVLVTMAKDAARKRKPK